MPIASMRSHTVTLRLLLRVFPVESRRGLCTAHFNDLRPESVLSAENRKSFAERFKLYKVPRKLKDDNASQAAVLIPLCTHRGELGILYTLRSTKLSSNRGQVSFPGGMRDKGDRDLEETALRETWEELKIPRETVDVWTSGNVLGKKNVNVLPVFGYVGEIDPKKLEINPDEVEEAFVVSLKNLCDPSLFRFTQFRNSYTLPAYLGGKHRVWGFTAAITHMALSALLPRVYKHKIVHLPSILPKMNEGQREKEQQIRPV